MKPQSSSKMFYAFVLPISTIWQEIALLDPLLRCKYRCSFVKHVNKSYHLFTYSICDNCLRVKCLLSTYKFLSLLSLFTNRNAFQLLVQITLIIQSSRRNTVFKIYQLECIFQPFCTFLPLVRKALYNWQSLVQRV